MTLETVFSKFLNDNIELIKELILDYGKYGFGDVLYDTDEFEKMTESCNQGTYEEEGYVSGWADVKDELFKTMLNKFTSGIK
jgi:hypothetical protein